jgi:hypothetical protein
MWLLLPLSVPRAAPLLPVAGAWFPSSSPEIVYCRQINNFWSSSDGFLFVSFLPSNSHTLTYSVISVSLLAPAWPLATDLDQPVDRRNNSLDQTSVSHCVFRIPPQSNLRQSGDIQGSFTGLRLVELRCGGRDHTSKASKRRCFCANGSFSARFMHGGNNREKRKDLRRSHDEVD